MSLEIKEIAFSDIDFFFNIHPITKDVPMLKNTAAIKRSIKNLVLTNAYDKFFEPSIFSDVLASLFENFDPVLVKVLQNNVRQVLQYEPRAQILEVNISDYYELDRNGINITIVFKPLNKIKEEYVEVFLERIR